MITQTPTARPVRTVSPFGRAVRTLGALLAAYLVVRAGIEFVTIDYGNAAGYRADWGGPSLAGVLAVHCGPGLAILGYFGYRLRRLARPGRGPR